MMGGQGLPPASSTVWRTKSVMPCLPAEGSMMVKRLMFSQPPPLGMTRMWSLSPGTISVWTTAGVLFFVLLRSENGFSTMEARR